MAPPPSLRRLSQLLSLEAHAGVSEAERLAERLAAEMAERWRRGERPSAETFLTQHPELTGQPEAAIQLIYEEICLRQEAGETVAPADFVRRFPQWQAELEIVLDCHHLLQPVRPPSCFPSVGQTLGGFRLEAELGRGALGRVFLARDPSLADRAVVLKVTPCDSHEHLALARLQHTHVVPLHSMHDFPERNLRALCMPYFGGVSLAQLLDRLRARPPAGRSGRQLLDALDQAPPGGTANPEEGVTFRVRGPARQFLARVSSVQAVCWLGACLADALHYAHERGLVHLDLKPSNVLLAADGQPMLLDFHLAREPVQPGRRAPEWLGGTPQYMSPEQRAAVQAVTEGRPVATAVDGRSDVYSLGLVLYEALGGPVPLPEPPPPLHGVNPQVSVGLSDLIAKCLAPAPGDRYGDAAALAADLRRHLHALPLTGVANRSLVERWQKWRQRSPYGLAVAGMLVVVLAALGTAWVTQHAQDQQRREARARQEQAAEQRRRDTEAALAESRSHFVRREYAAAAARARHGLVLAEDGPAGADVKQALDEQLRRAERAEAAHDLHAWADRLRFRYGADPSSVHSSEEARLAARCRSLWAHCDHWLDAAGAELDAADEQRLRTDLLDLGMLWAGLRARQADPEARRESLGILAEVEARFGSSPVIERQRQALTGKPVPPSAAARTAWEHTALGRSYLQEGKLAQAAAELERAVALRPDDFWANFYDGVCAFRQKRYEAAVGAFRVCIALAPETPECYFNRARAFQGLGRTAHALADYDRAIELNPTLTAAYLNRGLLFYQEKHFTEAAADLRQVLRLDPGHKEAEQLLRRAARPATMR